MCDVFHFSRYTKESLYSFIRVVTITKNIVHNCAFLFQSFYCLDSNVLNNNRTGHTTHCVNSGMLGPFRSVASKHQHKHNLPVFRSCLLSYSLRRNQRVLRINVLFWKLESFLTEISSHTKELFQICFSFHVKLRAIVSIEKSFSPNQPSIPLTRLWMVLYYEMAREGVHCFHFPSDDCKP